MKDFLFNDEQPVNATMTKTEFLLTAFIALFQTVLALITVENINILTACLGFAFLVLRNLPFVLVRFWEVFLFVFYKKHRSRMIMFWRDELKKRIEKGSKNDDDNEGIE